MDTIENIVYLATLISGGKRITAPFLFFVGWANDELCPIFLFARI